MSERDKEGEEFKRAAKKVHVNLMKVNKFVSILGHISQGKLRIIYRSHVALRQCFSSTNRKIKNT